ncbi:MAG: outer membrane beta-barrel domain-containing protein [Myxococcales bacterium]
MTKSRLVAWLALIVSSQVSALASAQDMSFGLEETESAGAEGDAAGEAATSGEAEGSAGGDVIGDLAGDDSSSTPKAAAQSTGPKLKEVSEEIYAVQQIYALRNNRLELMPSFGFTLNDPYVSHPNIGVGLNYWITNVLAVGANMNWYQGLEDESDLNFHVRRSTRLATRPTEFQFGASLNFTYVPFYGKFSMFNRYIFQWDAYVVGGVGVMRTRPVPVVDPEYRSFDYSYKLSIGNPGIGLRIFLSKWLTVFMEGRTYPYLEKLENLSVALGADRKSPSTWKDSSNTLVWNVVASVGMTIYFPFKFDYKLPK